jgi:hypothetical protein
MSKKVWVRVWRKKVRRREKKRTSWIYRIRLERSLKTRDPILLKAFLAWTVKTKRFARLGWFCHVNSLELWDKSQYETWLWEKGEVDEFPFCLNTAIRTRRWYHSLTTLWSLSFFAISRKIWGKDPRKKKVSVLWFPLFTHLILSISSFFPFVVPASLLWTFVNSRFKRKGRPVICIHAHPWYFPSLAKMVLVVHIM